VEPKKRPIEEVIKDLRDDDISDNAYYAIRELRDRLPDDKEAMDALIEALRSDDRQQRIIAGCILAPYANHARLSRNRQFLVVMAEALNDRSSLYGMGLGYAAEFFLSGQGECATDLLQSAALVSQDKRQRAYAAFLLAVRMKIHPGNRLRVEEILSDPASDYYLSSEYRQGALAMVAMQAEDSESRYKAPTNLIPDHIYVVKKGDILSEIARIHGTEWWKLAVYNCLPDPNRIEPGQEIFIPGTLSVRTEKQKPGTEDNRPNVEEPKHQAQGSGTGAVYEHIIYPGETLEDVVRMYGVSRQDIVRLNSITDPSSVKPGTKLLVPIPE
jgi:LysM repeat protein